MYSMYVCIIMYILKYICACCTWSNPRDHRLLYNHININIYYDNVYRSDVLLKIDKEMFLLYKFSDIIINYTYFFFYKPTQVKN